jgi:hypothetical protein
MGKVKVLACLAAVLAAAPCVATAAPGATALDFLRLDVGPRQIAMGGAGSALGGDANSMAYNPALLGTLGTQEFTFSHANWFQGIQYEDFVYAHPLSWGTLGAMVQRLGYGEIAGYDAAGARTGEISASDLLVGAAFARSFPRRGLSVGGTFKVARESIDSVGGQAFLFDLGASLTPRRRGFLGDTSWGLSVRNAGTSVKFDRESEPVPTEFLLGGCYRVMSEALLLSADARFLLRQGPQIRLGGEYWLLNTIALRLGADPTQDAGSGVRAGFGFKIQELRLDYTFLPMGDLGMTHHVGMRWAFGGPAEKAYQEGLGLMREGRDSEAALKFNEALNLNPKHPQAARRLRQAYEKMQEAPQN